MKLVARNIDTPSSRFDAICLACQAANSPHSVEIGMELFDDDWVEDAFGKYQSALMSK